MRPLQILIALDQLANALAGGWADESLSARAWRLRQDRARWSLAARVINGLFFWQPNHCEQAYLAERLRRQLPAEYRNNLHTKCPS